ncbi:MAG: PAS domain S-box protein, partial [Thermodesulfobacteriota bacterium]
HFYYLPLVLAVIWWKRRGLIVVLALSVILLASDLIFGFKESLVNDILRIGVFFLVAIVSVLLAEGLEDARVKAVENRLWYETIFRNTGTATAILGKEAVISMSNPQFFILAGLPQARLEGKKSLFDFIPETHLDPVKGYYRQIGRDTCDTPEYMDILFNRETGETRNIRLTFSLIPGSACIVATLTDLTALKAAMEEQKRLETKLSETLAKVLSGYLPICSRCKKIREESGRWREVESYIHAKTEADFTHTLCPACAQLLYPEIVAQMSGAEKKQLFNTAPEKPAKS